MDEVTKSRISGKQATYVAMAASRYPPVRIDAPNDPAQSPEATQTTPNLPAPADSMGDVAASRYPPVRIDAPNAAQIPEATQTTPNLPAPADGMGDGANQRKAPPRVRKPSPLNNQYLAPTADLEGFRGRLREAFGNTMSDEFVSVMLGKIIEALKPNPFDQLEEATLNSALAIIHSARCRSELEALIAVEIVATGFAGLRFLRQSQHFMTDDYIRTYGPYANKLLRLHLDLIQALDRHRRSHKQTVEVRHVNIHPGGQSIVGIVNAGERKGGAEK